MTDRPIIFSAPMVRALIGGTKSQTRRILRHPQRANLSIAPSVRTDHPEWIAFDHPKGGPLTCARWPYRIGDRLWVRETWGLTGACAAARPSEFSNPSVALRGNVAFRANGCGYDAVSQAWRPSIHMPRWASRLTLTVTDVRVQRVQEITPADAIAEGIRPSANSQTIDCDTPNPIDGFRALWNSIHGIDAWGANPWVAAITFDVLRHNIDAAPA